MRQGDARIVEAGNPGEGHGDHFGIAGVVAVEGLFEGAGENVVVAGLDQEGFVVAGEHFGDAVYIGADDGHLEGNGFEEDAGK